VRLHGCEPDMAAFADEAGCWIGLADRIGLTRELLEQSEADDRYRGLRWFKLTHTARPG
jgi:hypothetical protein